jgi:hypothetical protein
MSVFYGKIKYISMRTITGRDLSREENQAEKHPGRRWAGPDAKGNNVEYRVAEMTRV